MKKRENQVWRRRRCGSCHAVFSTEEAPRLAQAWRVRSTGHLEPFSRDKLFLSLYRSCEHRRTALGDAKGLTETVISRLAAYVRDGTVRNSDITGVTQVALNRFDKAASVHYAARHKGD